MTPQQIPYCHPNDWVFLIIAILFVALLFAGIWIWLLISTVKVEVKHPIEVSKEDIDKFIHDAFAALPPYSNNSMFWTSKTTTKTVTKPAAKKTSKKKKTK